MNGSRTSGHDAQGVASRGRIVAFVAVVAVCVAGALGYAGFVSWRSSVAAAASPITALEIDAVPASLASVVKTGGAASVAPAQVQRPYLMFRSTALGETYGRVSLEYLDTQAGQRFATPLRCERVHFASGRGICLEAKRGALTSYHAHVFDREFKISHSFALAGPPSRARMSADGRLAAVTVFVSGHSYASSSFTTRTSVIDATNGRMLADDLETFQVLREGAPFKAADFNFWGVTFNRDATRFYATLGTGGKRLLVEGDLASRRMQVIHDDVECPSLSPDGGRVAFKRRIAAGGLGRVVWRLHVLDLASGKETALAAETRNVDDQVEWLGPADIVYALPHDEQQSSAATNLRSLAVDGSGAPRLLTPLAFSPAVVR